MREPVRLDRVLFTPADAAEVDKGLLGWVRVVLPTGLQIDGLALRRTLSQRRLTLSFPERTDATGRRHPYVCPTDGLSRQAFEAAVFHALEAQGFSLGCSR